MWLSQPHKFRTVKAYLQKEPEAGLFDDSCPARLPSNATASRLRQLYRSIRDGIKNRVLLFCLNRSGVRGFGRLAARLACWDTGPYHLRAHLAEMTPRGFIAPSASLSHPDICFGTSVYVGDGVVITRGNDGKTVELNDRVHLYGDSFLETGSGAMISIGARTHVQPGCHLHAHLSSIHIGECVEIAANCGFFSYDHDVALGCLIMEQPLKSTGDIIVGDGAWLGYGVTVLQGVKIGAGAVIGAGSVVTRDIPDNAVAAGVPAKVIRFRTVESP